MKRLVILFALLFLPWSSMALAGTVDDYDVYYCTALTGGADGALDAIDGATLNDQDAAVVVSSTGAIYFYWLDDDSAAAEASPGVIAPDTSPGDKRWILVTMVIDDLTIGAAENPFIKLDELDGTDWWIGLDDTGNTLEFRTNVAVGTAVVMELNEDGTGLSIGDNGDDDITLTFNSNSNDGTIKWWEDEATFAVSSVVALTPSTYSFTTEVDVFTIGSTAKTTVILLDGDNDSDNDVIDLQNGTINGQVVIFIAAADIDADDTCTLNMADTTCTGCDASIVFDKVGDTWTFVWSGAAWFQLSTHSAP